MERPRRHRRLLAAVVTAVVGLLAGSQMLTSVPAGAADAASSSVCGPVSCTYTRTGQSLFRVPLGVTLLQVDVTGAGASPTTERTAAAGHSTPSRGQAVEVQGNLALSPNVSTLEVVVGGNDTLGGTTSEIMTSTDSASQVLVAADGVPVPATAKGGKPTSAAKAGAGKSSAAKSSASKSKVGKSKADKSKPGSKAGKSRASKSGAADRLVATPTRVPVDGTVVPATGPAKVVIRWRAPWQAPQVISAQAPVLTAGTPAKFVVRAIAATVPRLTEHGSLPFGLTFRDEGNGTAAIEGVPVVDGVYPLDVTVVAGAYLPVTEHVTLVVRGGLIRLGALTYGAGVQQPIASVISA